MIRTKYFARVYIASILVAAFAAAILLNIRHHRADQIAVALATPLILLQLVPYVLLKIPHEHPPKQSLLLDQISARTKRIVEVVIAALLVCALVAAIGVAILASLPIYHALGMRWAILPGAKIGVVLLLVGAVPSSFVAGTYLALRVKNVNFLQMLSGAAAKEGDRIGRIQHAA